ncbi:MAG: Rnf-Nqr domain containing protein [Pseudomonas sp.]|uniref:Rnf-Nqr domain containing protein n=1 Tax=Pseudomonas sp. TaxID=306 RepID=UPI003D109C26
MTDTRTAITLMGVLPLLGGTGLLVTAISIGLAGFAVLGLCGLLLMPLRRVLQGHALSFAALLLGSILVSVAALVLQMHSSELFNHLMPYLPLLVLPCLGLALDTHATARSGLMTGLLFAALALPLGLLREGLGNATLLLHSDWLLGPAAAGWHLSLGTLNGVHLLTLAPGAFILLGLLLAGFRYFRHLHHDDRP